MVHLCGHVHSAVVISAVCVSYAVDVYGLFWVKPCREHNAVCFMQAMYPGDIKFQQADPKYDWGLLVVLLAVEMDKKNWNQLCGDTEPQKMILQRV